MVQGKFISSFFSIFFHNCVPILNFIETNLYSVSPIAPVTAIFSLDEEEEKNNEKCCCYEKGFDSQEKEEIKENKFSGCQMNYFLFLPSRQQQSFKEDCPHGFCCVPFAETWKHTLEKLSIKRIFDQCAEF